MRHTTLSLASTNSMPSRRGSDQQTMLTLSETKYLLDSSNEKVQPPQGI